MADVLPDRPVWDDVPWTASPPLVGAVRATACVVGLGGSGLAALRELRALGVDAIGLDAGPVGGGAAGRNGGFLLAGLAAFHHHTAARLGDGLAAAIHRATEAELAAEADALPGIVRVTGSLRIAGDDDELADCAAHLAGLRAAGLAVEPYDGPEGRGILLPRDGVLQPLARVRAWASALRDAGVRLGEHSPVVAIEPGRVITAGGRVDCDVVIVAVDGRLEALLPELAPRVRTARLQMLATAPAPEVRLPRPVYRDGGDVYVRQLDDGRIALGGFRRLDPAAEWTRSAAPTPPVQAALDAFLREHLGVRAAVTHRWAASVAYTADGVPILEEVRPGVWATGAYSGTGNLVGVLGGRAAARRAVGRADGWGALIDAARAQVAG